MIEKHLAIDWPNFNGALGTTQFEPVDGRGYSLSVLPISQLDQTVIHHLKMVSGCYEIGTNEIEERAIFGAPVVELNLEHTHRRALDAFDNGVALAKTAIGAKRIRILIGQDLLPGAAECSECGELFAPTRDTTGPDQLAEHSCRPAPAPIVQGKDPVAVGVKPMPANSSGFACSICEANLPTVADYEQHMAHAHVAPE